MPRLLPQRQVYPAVRLLLQPPLKIAKMLAQYRLPWGSAPTTGGSEITRYELRIWYNGQWNEADDLEAETAAQVIEDLTPSQLYYFATRAWNSAGGGPWSLLASTTASTDAPDAPDLTATAVDSNSILLTWTVPEANGSTITGYELVVWNNDPNDGGWETGNLLEGSVPALSVHTTEFTHDERLAGTEYFYRIRALTDTGVGSEWSADDNTDAKSAKTFGDVPGQIADAPTVAADTGGDGAGKDKRNLVSTPRNRWLCHCRLRHSDLGRRQPAVGR